MTVPIYRAELEAGLGERIKDNKIVLSSCLNSVENVANFDFGQFSTTAKANDFDLYPLNTILVSVGWNKNTDIFDKQELWAAYQTAEDKPLNIGHNHTKIVGHITSCKPIQIDASKNVQVLDINLPIDSLPDVYHILTSAVLYRELKPEAAELKKEIEQVIAEIKQGLWFVSMECLFRGFDYGMIDAGEHKIVPRNQETAFLTKHLMAYGGSGRYNGKLIGRVLRNITFSGKGLVKNPANPYSIIIAEQFKPNLTTAEIGVEMKPEELENKVESIANLLTSEAERRQVKAKAKAEKSKLKTEAKEARRKEKAEAKKAKLEASKAKIAELEAKVTSLEKSKADALKELETVKAELAESVKMFNAVRVSEQNLQKDKKTSDRSGKVMNSGVPKDKALGFVEKTLDLSDEAFAAIVEAMPKAVASTDTTVPATELETKVTTAGTAAVAAAVADKAEAGKKLSADLAAFLTKAKKE